MWNHISRMIIFDEKDTKCTRKWLSGSVVIEQEIRDWVNAWQRYDHTITSFSIIWMMLSMHFSRFELVLSRLFNFENDCFYTSKCVQKIKNAVATTCSVVSFKLTIHSINSTQHNQFDASQASQDGFKLITMTYSGKNGAIYHAAACSINVYRPHQFKNPTFSDLEIIQKLTGRRIFLLESQSDANSFLWSFSSLGITFVE